MLVATKHNISFSIGITRTNFKGKNVIKKIFKKIKVNYPKKINVNKLFGHFWRVFSPD